MTSNSDWADDRSRPVRCAGTFIFLLLAAGCATSPVDSGTGPVTLKDAVEHHGVSGAYHALYEEVFRGFHQKDFPTNEWVIEGNILRSVAGPDVDLITVELFESFILDLEWKVSRGANAGILYGVSEETSNTYWSGPEYQINDDPNHDDGQVPVTAAGALYDLIPANDKKHLNPTGAWNHTRIVSRNGKIEHWLNGAKILEYGWNDAATRNLINQSKFKDSPLFMKSLDGHLALQHHGADVWFRNVIITRL